MDLDDILNKAEDHETMQAETGASLGGEGFLQQFAVVNDIKNDLSWDDIIPLEERQKFEREEAEAKEEEMNQTRKRTAANVNYEGMDVDQPAAGSSKPKAKTPTTKSAAPRKSAIQRSMELKERDVRVLIRSLQRWGDVRQRYDIIVSIFCAFHA
jgi:chromodomain-helicase-DNA-binding protein 1